MSRNGAMSRRPGGTRRDAEEGGGGISSEPPEKPATRGVNAIGGMGPVLGATTTASMAQALDV